MAHTDFESFNAVLTMVNGDVHSFEYSKMVSHSGSVAFTTEDDVRIFAFTDIQTIGIECAPEATVVPARPAFSRQACC